MDSGLYEQTTTHINNHKQPTHKIKTTYSQEQCRIQIDKTQTQDSQKNLNASSCNK